jgi:FkbM family methyltransferase
MLEWVFEAYALIFARPIFAKLNYFIFHLSLRGLGIFNYRTPLLTGESGLLRRLLPVIDLEGSIALDVGANEGSYSRKLLSETSQLRVICYEPHPKSFERLKGNLLGHQDRASFRNLAVGDKQETVNLYDYADSDGSSHASLYKEVIEKMRGRGSVHRPVEIVPLDSDLSPQESSRVVLLKIDTEGHEKQVLLGARRLIGSGSSSLLVVQAEFNEMNVISRTFFLDLAELLPNFVPYRLLPGGRLLPLRPYNAWRCEQYAFQNVVFIKAGVKF